MTAASLAVDDAAPKNRPQRQVPLVPRFGDAIHSGMDEVTTAWWALDISNARSVIALVAANAAPVDWVRQLVVGLSVADVDQNTVHLVGPYAGRNDMIGRPIVDYWPQESWPVLADLIMAAAANYPEGAIRSREITSIAFSNAVLNASAEEDCPDIVFLSVGGQVVDERSLWLLRASEERYRNLLHHLPIPLLQVDASEIGEIYQGLKRQGVDDLDRYVQDHPKLVDLANELVVVTEANMSAAHLFGVAQASDLIGPVGFLFAASPLTARRVMSARFNGMRSHSETTKARTFDGRLLDVEINVTYPRPPERLDVTLISIEDVTERLRTEAELRQLQADYTRAARISMMGELATSIAHEVNQPLSAIVTNAETSLRWLSREDPNLAKVSQLTSRIAESARHAGGIVQRIRSMAVQGSPEYELLELNQIVDEAMLFLRHELESRSITVSVLEESELPALFGDRVQLQQVIVNLLLNSAQALGFEKAKEGRIEMATSQVSNSEVRFTIRDNGPGLPDDTIGRIFDSFFTTKEEGMGIGLAICQSIITAHGGTITAANHPLGGAQFELTLPAAEH